MDLCNLYVKGLSLSMTSAELFNLFQPYGRIISARVMVTEKNVSKGFGFVSFSQPIEAASALVYLHPHYNIQFHEPKVPRPGHDIQQQYWSLAHSSLACYFYSVSLDSPSWSYYYPSSYYYPVYYGPVMIQRSDMQRAVQQALANDKQQQDIVDWLMTLDDTEKRHCLENTAYLKAKLDQLSNSFGSPL
ncbi:hypothetical protein BC941DRAFT_413281 [Chlamydoabsidia padenii]|nr:hypothetical protein BC941DRAFT_413281 [Chlamydoabsidia padenii]